MTEAIVYTEFGAPEVLHLAEVTLAEPGAGEVAVRIEAAGVNPLDWKQRSGLRPTGDIVEPRRVGFDGAGVITAVGEGVEGIAVGDPVALFNAPGTYATDIVVPVSSVAVRPASVPAPDAAALGIPIGTAYQCVRSLDVGPDDVLLVHGGSGSVGQAVIQFAVAAGATVIATTSDRRADRVRELGATPVAYGEGLADRVREVAPQGVTAALDCVGTDEALQTSIELVADKNRVATIVRGADAAGLGIRAFSGGSPEPLTAQELQWRVDAVGVALSAIDAGTFSVELGPQLPLAEAAKAHHLVEDGVDGKVTLLP